MKAATYVRKSRYTEPNMTVEEVIAKHNKILNDYAAERGITIVHRYEEVVSGEKIYTRPQMMELLSDVEDGRYEALLVIDIDRLSRGNAADQEIILNTLKENDVKIITPRKIYDLNNDMDEDITEFEAFFARREYKTINRRLRRGLNLCIDAGGYVENPPYGYDRDFVNKISSLKINEPEAEFVKMIFSLYVQQHKGCSVIADTINGLGATPPRGRKFNRTSIRTILRNPIYTGNVVKNRFTRQKKNIHGETKILVQENAVEDWKVIHGLHPAIIDWDTFKKAREIMEKKANPGVHFDGTLTNPFAGLIVCRRCGKKIQLRTYQQDGHTYTYALCYTKGCVKATPISYIEDSIFSYLKQVLKEIHTSVKTVTTDDTLVRALESVQRELKTSQTQLNRLHDLLEQGVYNIDTFMSRRSLLEEKIKELQSSVSSLEKKQKQNDPSRYERLAKKIEHVLTAYQNATPNEQNAMLKSIIKQCLYYKDKTFKTDEFDLQIELNL